MVDKELKELEHKIFMRYFEDGFWDIYLGLLLLSFGLTITFELGYLAGVFGALGVLIPRVGKSKYTYPRVGYIKFRDIRRRNVGMIVLGVLIFGVVLFFFFSGSQENPITEFLRNNILLIIALIWSGALVTVASILDVKHYFYYALLVFVGIYGGNWVGSLGINLIVTGGIIVIVGLIIMILFIRKHPIIERQE